MLIREAAQKDLPEVLELLKGMDDESEMDMDEALQIWDSIKKYPYYKIIVVEDECRIIGTYSLIIIDNLGHRGGGLAVVESVIVEKSCRGKGVGKLMMNHAMELAKAERCYKLMLSSNKKRIEAHKFYQRLGFNQHGISFAIEVE